MRVKIYPEINYSAIKNNEAGRIRTRRGYLFLPSDKTLLNKLESMRFYRSEPVDIKEIISPMRELLKMRSVWGIRRINEERSNSIKEYESVEIGLMCLGYEIKPSACKKVFSEEDIFSALRNFYTRDSVSMAYEGKATLPNLSDFFKSNNKNATIYIKMRRENGRVKAYINSLYPEFPNLYDYISGHIPITAQRIEETKNMFVKASKEGLDVSRSGLVTSTDARSIDLLRRVRAVNNYLSAENGKNIGHTRLLKKWGIKNVRGKYDFNQLGNLGELFIRAIVAWGGIAHNRGDSFDGDFRKYFSIPLRDVLPHQKGRLRAYLYDGNGDIIYDEERPFCIMPDIRVDSSSILTGVEVKTGICNITERKLRNDIAEKYSLERRNIVFFGNGNPPIALEEIIDPEIIGKSVAVFNMKKSTLPNNTGRILEDNNVLFVESEEVLSFLEELSARWGSNPLYDNIQRNHPFLFDPSVLVELYKKMVYYPHLLQDKANASEFKWLKLSLEKIIGLGIKTLENEYEEQPELGLVL